MSNPQNVEYGTNMFKHFKGALNDFETCHKTLQIFYLQK